MAEIALNKLLNNLWYHIEECAGILFCFMRALMDVEKKGNNI
jgi:hypothetical protein